MSSRLTDVLSISASADGLAWAVNKSHQVFKYEANTGQWQQVPGTLSNISAGNGSNTWGVSTDGEVWKYDGNIQVWNPVPGPDRGLVQVSASNDGQVWGVSVDGTVWRYAGGTENWERIPASKATYVSVGTVNNIWSVDVAMDVWFYYPSGLSIPWAPVIHGQLVQVSAGRHREGFPAGVRSKDLFHNSPDGAAWGVNSSGEVFRYRASYPWARDKMGSGYKQISVGSSSNAWAIDMNDMAVCLTPARPEMGMGGEPWVESQQKRWDSRDKYDESQSTHLWIVTRAAEVARADSVFGNKIFNLVQPGVSQGKSEFHDALSEGLWDADAADPYRNTVLGLGVTATYKSHFYDPETGKNWLEETEPTALTEGPKFFAEAAKQYKNGNIHSAGYNLGLSLHYLTDMTQPMHTTNYTYLNSTPVGYHTAFEDLAIDVMKEIQITQPYVPSKLGSDPSLYIKAAAMKSRPRSDEITSSDVLQAWQSYVYDFFFPWRNRVIPEIKGALIDGVAITAQYLIAWMQTAVATVATSDQRLFSQAYGGGKAGYWAVDQDGHLFRRLGWDFGWILIPTPGNIPVVSLAVDREGGAFVVTSDGVLYLTSEEKWERVYPPPLVGNDEILPDIRQLAVVEGRALWALDTSGAAYQGEGALPQVKWFETSSPKLTSISANSPDSAWGANAGDQSVWEYAAGRWDSRGTDVVQVSVDTSGQAWGISSDGKVLMYAGSLWQTPPEFSDATGQHRPPDWGPLAWVSTRGQFVVVDRRGVAWAPSGIMVAGEDPWMPLG
ncbi:MAG TPA: tectonin domain-containing protein [Blastocatellia bacterium]|nr:tectonin domain-containing protein [Blastocatellia bacterium]